MDINSFITGFSMGKKKGGSAVLTELTVTENGVYDEPVISNAPEPITWDGIIGDRPFVPGDGGNLTTGYVKVSDAMLSASDLVGATMAANNGTATVIDESMVDEIPDVLTIGTEAVLSVHDADAANARMGFAFTEEGTYFFCNLTYGEYIRSLTFAGGEPTPADGWNKVTVNVAGDIVDVAELPTENIEEGKIYRVAEYTDTVSLYRNDGTSVAKFEDIMEAIYGTGRYVRGIYNVVDVLPEGKAEVDRETMTVQVYVLRDSGEAFIFHEGQGWVSVFMFANYVMFDMNAVPDDFVPPEYQYIGIANSTDDMTEVGYYTLFDREVAGAIYGIPNAHPVKRFVDGAWVELT